MEKGAYAQTLSAEILADCGNFVYQGLTFTQIWCGNRKIMELNIYDAIFLLIDAQNTLKQINWLLSTTNYAKKFKYSTLNLRKFTVP